MFFVNPGRPRKPPENATEFITEALNSPIIHPELESGFSFRPSECPVCPYGAVWSTLLGTPSKDHWHEHFYYDIGKSVHLVTQKWLARSNFMLGNWSCTSCGHEWGPNLSPQVCPTCGGEARYEEITLYGPSGLKGHPDGILWFPDCVKILEIKTTSMNNVKTITSCSWHQSHVTQASIYVELVNLWFESINIPQRASGICFMYIPRDNPKQYRILDVPPKAGEMQKNIERVNKAQLALRTGEFGKLTNFCNTIADADDCMWKGLCFRDPVGEMTRLWNERGGYISC